MHEVGMILTILGGLLVWISTLGLVFLKSAEDDKEFDPVDAFVFRGGLSFLDNFICAIREGIRDRSSDAFGPVILLGVSIAILGIGLALMKFSG